MKKLLKIQKKKKYLEFYYMLMSYEMFHKKTFHLEKKNIFN